MIRYKHTGIEPCEHGHWVRYSDLKEDVLYRSYTVEKAAYDAMHGQLAWMSRLNLYAAVVLCLSAVVNVGFVLREML